MVNIFTMFNALTDEQLAEESGNLVAMEIATRNSDLETLRKIEPCNTDEAIFSLSCFNRLGCLESELTKRSVGLFSLFTKFRTVTLFTAPHYYSWLLGNITWETGTEFDILLSKFRQLQQNVVKEESRVFRTLLDFSFSPQEIFYFNLYLYSGKGTEKTQLTLLVNCINSFGQKSTELLEPEKELIMTLLKRLRKFPSYKVRDAFKETTEIELDKNWEWFYSLHNQYFDYSCKMIRVYPSIQAYFPRFQLLTDADKLCMIDFNLVAFNSKESFLEFMDKLGLNVEEYLSHAINSDNKTIQMLLDLNLIQLSDLDSKKIRPFIQGIPTTKAFLWLINSLDTIGDSWNYLTADTWHYYNTYTQIKNIPWDSFDVEDAVFMEGILSIFENLCKHTDAEESINTNKAVLFIYSLMKSTRFCKILGKETVKELCDYFLQIKVDCNVNEYVQEIEDTIFSEEECVAIRDARKVVIDEQNEQIYQEEKVELSNYFRTYFKNTTDVDSLLNKYADYTFARFVCVKESKVLDNYVLRRLKKFSKSELTHSRELVKVLYNFYDEQVCSFTDFRNLIDSITEKGVTDNE